MPKQLYNKDLFGNDYVQSRGEAVVGNRPDALKVWGMLESFMDFDEEVIQENFGRSFDNFIEALADFNETSGPFSDGKSLFTAYCEDNGLDSEKLISGSSDPVAIFIADAFAFTNDLLEDEARRITSVEYAVDMFEEYSDMYQGDIEENCQKAFKEDPHGFASVKDLITAVKETRPVEIDGYDGGGYGWHSYKGDEDYIELGFEFLGNSEEESQIDGIPLDFESIGLRDSFDVYLRGDCIYVTNNSVVYFFVTWESVIQTGKELGLID